MNQCKQAKRISAHNWLNKTPIGCRINSRDFRDDKSVNYYNLARKSPQKSQVHAILFTSKWTLWWRHNDHAGVSNHQPHGCLLNRLFRRKSKKTSKPRVTGLCAGNSPGISRTNGQLRGKCFHLMTSSWSGLDLSNEGVIQRVWLKVTIPAGNHNFLIGMIWLAWTKRQIWWQFIQLHFLDNSFSWKCISKGLIYDKSLA